MHGLVVGHLELRCQDYLEAVIRAGRWLIDQQDPDGCWRRNTHNGIPHTYNTHSARALLRVGLLASESAFVAAAERNLDWALTQVTPSGWLQQNAFRIGEYPFTHAIYAMLGFLEVGVFAGREPLLDAVAKAALALALALAQRADGRLAGEFADD